MSDEEYKIETKVMPYRFWLFVSLTAFLIITFIYYLPLRFRHGAVGQMEGHMIPAVHGVEQYHEENEIREGLTVNLNVIPAPIMAATPTRLVFFVNEKPGNIPVADLEIEHTKLMHVIGARNDMEEFFHIHPVQTQAGLFSIDHAFVKPGLYKIWSEIKKDGVNHAFGHPEIVVEGTGEKYKKEVFFGRSAIVGNYQVLLHYDEPITKGKNIGLHFEVHDVVGREIEVEPYLAADMHLTVIKDDWKQFIHTHPTESEDHKSSLQIITQALANGGDDHRLGVSPEHGIGFQVNFPEAGIYKAFAQFRPKGTDLPQDEALTASFWIRVEESKPLAFSNWWINLAVSLILIVLLSWGVRKYLSQGA